MRELPELCDVCIDRNTGKKVTVVSLNTNLKNYVIVSSLISCDKNRIIKSAKEFEYKISMYDLDEINE